MNFYSIWNFLQPPCIYSKNIKQKEALTVNKPINIFRRNKFIAQQKMHHNHILKYLATPAVTLRQESSVKVKLSSNLAFIMFTVNARQFEKI